MYVGQRECAFERWLGYHAGRHGTGYRRRATAIPLATGAGVHNGIGLLGQWLLEYQQHHPGQRVVSAPDEVIAWAATEAADRYAHAARTRGLALTNTDLDAAHAVEQLILEQRTLIEAQVWIYALARLPVMLAQAVIVDVEREEGPVIDCTCGLGDWVGQWPQHAARNCWGIVHQDRSDLIWELLDSHALATEEIKTKSIPNYGWEQQWEHSGQLWIHMEAASRRLGKDVTQAFVPVLYKGKRDRVNRDDKQSPRIQMSPLVYGWWDPGAPPLREADWSARYKWFDDWGNGHTLPKTYQRQLVVADVPLPVANPNGVAIRADATRVEQWVKGWILPALYPELLKVLGPFPKPAVLIEEAQRSVLTEERRWRADVEYLRQAGIFQPSDYAVTDDGAKITAADIITRSWACTKFGGDACAFKPICHREPGWKNIERLDAYEIRTPHHASEKDAMTPTITELGLAWTAEDDEDADGGRD